VSTYYKRQIVEKLGIAPHRVTVTYCAPAPQYSPSSGGPATSKTSGHLEGCDSVLGIASAAPRKNTGALVTAYARLAKALRDKHPLALVCTHAGVREILQAKIALLSLNDHVRLLTGVEDSELVQLYRSAGVFVFPSLEEGFGLPPLEAMACGTPVVASNTSSLPEVLGDAALLVDPTDVEALAGAIEAVLTDPSLADSLRHRGPAHCRQFSWERTAKGTLAVYESIRVAQ